jgi:hypothetical protein
MRRSYVALFIGVALLCGGIAIYDWWVHRGLITLDAVDKEVAPVLKEISRQSGFPVLTSTNTTGKVTVHFRRVPLTEALDVLGDQVEGRWQQCFLIARNSGEIANLGIKLAESGPPVLITQFTGRFMGGAPAEPQKAAPAPTQFSVLARDLHTAGLMLALQSRTPVLVEDALNPMVNLKVPWDDTYSVAQKLACAGGGKAQLVYLFQTMRGWRFGGGRGGGGGGTGENESPGERFARRSPDGGDSFTNREDRMARLYEEQLPLLPPEEQEAIRKARERWENRRQELATLSPEERRAKMAEWTNDPNREARNDQRAMNQIKNLTPEQRASRNRRYAERARQRGVMP